MKHRRVKQRHTESAIHPSRRRDRPRWVTAVFFMMCMIVLLGAFASRNNLLYWFVGMAIGTVLAHGFAAGPPMMRILLGRVDIPDMTERGRPAAAHVEVISQNRFRTARAIRIEIDLVGRDGRRVVARGGLAAIGPGDAIRVPVDLRLERRGVYDVAKIRLVTTFPFGLSKKQLDFAASGRVVCAPSDAALADADRVLLQRSAARHAADVQPGDIREYVRGDPRRLIAWRASARARRPLVRDFETQRSQRLWIRCHAPRAPLIARDADAEQMLDRAAAIGKHAAQLSYQVGVLHEPTGTRTIDPNGLRWIVTLSELGDRDDLVAGPGPRPGDLIIDVTSHGSSPSSREASA